MSSEHIPRKDAEYGPWITTFASVATANATLLNLSSGQTTTLTGFAVAYNAAQEDSIAKKAAAEGATATKRNIRSTSEELFRATARVITANGNIADSLKSDLGLNVVPGSLGPVVPVTDFAGQGYANGANKLKWNRNGNAYPTNFRIEARYGSSLLWTFVANTTKARYKHSGQIPGQQVTYRIISERAEVLSDPSNFAVVYGPEEGEVITLSHAA